MLAGGGAAGVLRENGAGLTATAGRLWCTMRAQGRVFGGKRFHGRNSWQTVVQQVAMCNYCMGWLALRCLGCFKANRGEGRCRVGCKGGREGRV